MSPQDLRFLFEPRTVAVIGASRKPGKVGHEVLRNLRACGFSGRLFPVNPNARSILGFRCYPSVIDVDEDVDLAVMIVPAQKAVSLAGECGKKGVRGLLVISSGFREVGRKGAELERQLLSTCREYDMRMVGPNCLGIIDTLTPLNASFAATMPLKGQIAFMSQSGALCTSVLDWSKGEGIGFSRFISLGNKADLNEVDFMNVLAEHRETRVIITYLESIEEGSRFLSVAEKTTRKKPIVALKSGRSSKAARAASSHTGALAGHFAAYEAAFKQGGILVAQAIEELFDLALALSTQPIPRGRDVAIITNAGGPGVVAVDACASYDLDLARLSSETTATLRKGLLPAASTYNPIDILGDADAKRYRLACEAALADENVDGIIVLLSPQAMTEPEKTARHLVQLKRKFPKKPILTSFMGGDMVRRAIGILRKGGIPSFPFPERSVAATSGLARYADYLQTERGQSVQFWDIDKQRVREVFHKVREDRRVVLLPHETSAVIRAYGIPTPPTELVTSVKEAVRVAEGMGYPVVLKVASPQIIHKTDIKGIALNLGTPTEVKQSYRYIMTRTSQYLPTAKLYGVIVQKQVPIGRELIVGVTRDLQFGPLLMFGLGGIYADFLKDVSYRLAPVTLETAKSMITETKSYLLLKGIRGESPYDVSSLVNVMLRVSQLVTDYPEVAEMDINPLFLFEEGRGCVAVDVKMTLSPRR
ncbi:MAG: acetate--CoA ligase alpha subunit [Candidatus Bathyarchaeia archaeon]